MPNKYGNISEIAQYNRDNGTNFYTMEQVEQHKRKNSEEEFEKKHPFLVSLSKSAQEARDARIGAIGAEQVRDLYNKGENELASELNDKYLGANASGILGAPMAGEFATYGPLVGALRLGAGTAGSAAGSYIAGKAGDFADKKLGTNWIGNTGRILGGFAGFGAGMKSTTPLLQRAAARNISLGIPKETFVNLRKEGLSSEVARALNKEIRGTDFIPGQVKYYGPTMGKTTATKTNPNLVDFDDIMRKPSKDILKKYGFKSKYEMFESGNQDAINEYQNTLIKGMQDFKSNPQNSGRTLVVSQSPVVNPEVTRFKFDNEPSIPSKQNFITRNVGRGGTEADSADWWENLMERNPNLKIDNRFVSEIEGNKVINHSGQTGNRLGELELPSEKGWDHKHFKTNTYFGEYLGSGAESDVYQSPFTNDVIKISSKLRSTPNEAVNSSIIYMRDRNKVPFLQKPIERIGIMRFKDKYTPVYKQETVKPLSNVTADEWKNIKSVIDSRMKANGYVKDLSETYKSPNGKAINFWDFKDENFGIDKNGDLFAIDLDVFKQGGILKRKQYD